LNTGKNKFERELKVKSSTDNLSAIRDFVKLAAEDFNIQKDIAGKIVLAVDEACTNVVKHAYQYSPDGDITIKLGIENDRFVISITDNGRTFDPELVPDPDIRKYHKERKIGGLGMFLMKKLMDEVTYKTLPNNRNQVVLVKYI
jgi:serine/threonine-protein kinase RsbW